ncbi:glycosyltransferase [Rhodopseudomonas sp. AAP120]|uniref:glycosyltransferase n=1 Tax=Rhodopseudomonas sp. AAP120 TaxID=1523430 RepID=UPI000AA2ACF3|nr:glycosyltransferase [Rhodopseudomonas sp. AAP120]
MLRILFFISDTLTAYVRIIPLLAPLCTSGRARLAFVDRNMRLAGQVSDRYDVLIAHRNLSQRQTTWLRERNLPFVYDIDDLILTEDDAAAPDRGRRHREQQAIRWCLSHAAAVTSPSRRLLSELDRRLDGIIAAKARFLPNPGQDRLPARKGGGCGAILWTSSAEPMLAPDIEEVCAGIGDVARAQRLEVLLIGRFPPQLRACLGPGRTIEWLEPPAYLRLLAGENLVAVAPLSRQLPPALQRFADCKSDIKIAQYDSSRIAGAYSPAPPFQDSDLPRRIVSENSRAAWRDAVIELVRGAPEFGNALAEDAAVLARHPAGLAESLRQVLTEVAQQTGSFGFWAIPTPDFGRRLEQGIRTIKRRLYARGRQDVAC